MKQKPLGSLVGAIGGLVFVLVNAGGLPGALIWQILGVLGLLGVIFVTMPRTPTMDAPGRGALRAYVISVVAMLVAIPVGALTLTRVLDQPHLVLPWVIFVVGAHFWPFAKAFGYSIYRSLALAMMAVAVVGGLAAWVSGSAAPGAWAGVVTGFVMLFFSGFGPLIENRRLAN